MYVGSVQITVNNSSHSILSLMSHLHVPPGKNGLVNEVEFPGLITQKW